MIDQLGNLFFYLNDHLGSARVVLNAQTGQIADYHWYYAYGAPLGEQTSTGQAYKYTGKPFDDEGGFDLYYYGARYYDPEIGVFRAVDPLYGKYPGWGPYVYVRGNPLRRIDPTGTVDEDAEGQKANWMSGDVKKKVVNEFAQLLVTAGSYVEQTITFIFSGGPQAKVSLGTVSAGASMSVDVAVSPSGAVKDISAGAKAEVQSFGAKASSTLKGSLLSNDVSASLSVSSNGAAMGGKIGFSSDGFSCSGGVSYKGGSATMVPGQGAQSYTFGFGAVYGGAYVSYSPGSYDASAVPSVDGALETFQNLGPAAIGFGGVR